MDQWQQQWLMEEGLALGISRPTSFVMVTSLESASPEQIMEELRQKDPEAHAKLSEIVVIDDDGHVVQESIETLVAWIEALT